MDVLLLLRRRPGPLSRVPSATTCESVWHKAAEFVARRVPSLSTTAHHTTSDHAGNPPHHDGLYSFLKLAGYSLRQERVRAAPGIRVRPPCIRTVQEVRPAFEAAHAARALDLLAGRRLAGLPAGMAQELGCPADVLPPCRHGP